MLIVAKGVDKMELYGNSRRPSNTSLVASTMLIVLLHLWQPTKTIQAQPVAGDVTQRSTKASVPRDSWASNGPNAYISSLIVDPTNSKILYAQSFFVPGGIFKSIDKGATWLPASQGLSTLRVNSIAINPQDARILYAATSDGVHKTIDSGGNWSPTSAPREGIYPVAVDPSDPSIVYAGTCQDLISSHDSGNTWSFVSHVLDPCFLDKIVVDPSDSSVIYAGYNLFGDTFFSYLSKSTDAGVNFRRLEFKNTGGVIVYALKIDPSNPSHLHAATPYGIYRSPNGGETWFRRNLFLGGTSALAIMPFESGHLFTSFYDDKGYNQGVSESTNDDGTWAGFGTGLNMLQIYALELDSSGSDLYAATQSGVYSIRTAADAGPVTISGRFTTVSGRGLSNVIGSITDTLGGSQTFRGNQMGFYKISNVNPGSRYIITANSKSNAFASRTLQVNGTLTNINFTPTK